MTTGQTIKEKTYLKKIQLRNLKRQYSKIKEHPELLDETLELDKEIRRLENEIGEIG